MLTGKQWFEREAESILSLTQVHDLSKNFGDFKNRLIHSASPNRQSSSKRIQFGSELGVPLSYRGGQQYKFHISVDLCLESNSNDLEKSSYAVVILDVSTGEVCRRFHIDYEPYKEGGSRSSEPKPSFHHQQFGKLRSEVFQGSVRDAYSASFPNFEKPRLLTMPMPILVVLHWLFREFYPWNQETLS